MAKETVEWRDSTQNGRKYVFFLLSLPFSLFSYHLCPLLPFFILAGSYYIAYSGLELIIFCLTLPSTGIMGVATVPDLNTAFSGKILLLIYRNTMMFINLISTLHCYTLIIILIIFLQVFVLFHFMQAKIVCTNLQLLLSHYNNLFLNSSSPIRAKISLFHSSTLTLPSQHC